MLLTLSLLFSGDFRLKYADDVLATLVLYYPPVSGDRVDGFGVAENLSGTECVLTVRQVNLFFESTFVRLGVKAFNLCYRYAQHFVTVPRMYQNSVHFLIRRRESECNI